MKDSFLLLLQIWFGYDYLVMRPKHYSLMYATIIVVFVALLLLFESVCTFPGKMRMQTFSFERNSYREISLLASVDRISL